VTRGRRRVLAVLGLSAFAVAVLVLPAPAPALAHPLGNFTVNRYSGLLLAPGRIRITYVVDMAEIPTFQERGATDTDGDGVVSEAERGVWAGEQARDVMANLSLTVDGRPVPLSIQGRSMTLRPGQGGLPTLYFRAILVGRLPVSGSLHYVDHNGGGRIGWREITATSTDGVAVVASEVPADSVSGELTVYPQDRLSSPLDVTEASMSFRPGPGHERSVASDATPKASPQSGGTFTGLVSWRLTPMVLVLSLGIAFALGALHALGPGHGKTITAAYMVGHQARPRQAIAAAMAVALMHSFSVLALGLVAFALVRSLPTDQVYPWLGLLTGVVALGLGTWLLVIRIRARRRGLDPWHNHRHTEAGHPHVEAAGRMSRRDLAALGISGGLLPSPTALLVLTASVASHRVGYGLALIFAFSLGLAASLVGVALVAIQARTFVARRLRGRLNDALPVGSASVIVGFGLFFLFQGIVTLT
jgi:ABC-type nickel/cobalt efflux system permease component RcnA